MDELDCHVFVHVVFTSVVFTYLYKYLHKGPDHTWFHIPHQPADHVDEIKDYVDGRYLSAPEAAWRILGFEVTSKDPSVSCLPIHLPGENKPKFDGSCQSQSTPTSLLMRYFHRPTSPVFLNLKYVDYFQQYVLYPWNGKAELAPGEFLEQPIPNSTVHKVFPRQRKLKVVRLQTIPPTTGELFYFRCLMAHRPSRSFVESRTIDGVIYPTYHEAAVQVGIFSPSK